MGRSRCVATDYWRPSRGCDQTHPTFCFSCACIDNETHKVQPHVQNKKMESRWSLWRDRGFQSHKITNWDFTSARELSVCCLGSVFGSKSLLHNSWQQQRFIENAVPATVQFKLISSESSEPVETLRSAESTGGLVHTAALWLSRFYTNCSILPLQDNCSASGVFPPANLCFLSSLASGAPSLHLWIFFFLQAFLPSDITLSNPCWNIFTVSPF